MARGRPPLDAETKAARRKESLLRYAAASAPETRAPGSCSYRLQERRPIAPGSSSQDENAESSEAHACALASAARYRERNRDKIREVDRVRRAELYLRAHGADALDERQDRRRLVRTHQRHRGRLPPPLPAHPPRQRNTRNAREVLTANQKRCRALRRSGFEEDNGEDSDTDLAPGICGCDLTECQRDHKNETQDRRDWKNFHLKYAKELEGTR
ncbi:hypothetical protein DFH06DRAFT_1121208 [Mycena polygramma]|nr:hypothetical protein DFH06DRAFT_1121208 [Mycena polygramma]